MEKYNNKHSLNIVANIAKLAQTAEREKWVVQYDSELDSFYWTRPKISANAKLTKFLEDFALYVNPAGNIEGLFIEYARNNFVNHNEVFEPLFASITEKIEDNIMTIPKKKQSMVKDYLGLIADKIAAETAIGFEDKNLNLNTVFA